MRRVRLHAGGIPMSEVRLARRGASERRTAPGRDIRDVGPDKGPRSRTCRCCAAAFLGRGPYCGPCTTDREIVRSAVAKLKAVNQPGVNARTQDGAAYGKVRKKAEAARRRLDERAEKMSASADIKTSLPGTDRRAARAVALRPCPSCNLELPATGRCDGCEVE